MMKFFSILFFVLLCEFSFTQTLPFPSNESSLLWKIEGNGLKKTSYLFGTMHLIEKEYFYFPDKLSKIVSKSDALVMEIASLPSQGESMKLLTLKEGTFFDFFSKEQMDTIYKWANAELGLTEDGFRLSMEKIKPFVLVQLASQKYFLGKTESYELTLMELAAKKKVETLGLETLEQQMGIFDRLSKDQQAEMVMSGIRDFEKSIEETKEMQKLYLSQNIDSLYTYIHDGDGVIAEEQAAFLDDRNEQWIPKISEIIQAKSTFIAVGAGHLGGQKGVVRLLQEKGYVLTPIKL